MRMSQIELHDVLQTAQCVCQATRGAENKLTTKETDIFFGVLRSLSLASDAEIGMLI